MNLPQSYLASYLAWTQMQEFHDLMPEQPANAPGFS
jgi:hypothetical protein